MQFLCVVILFAVVRPTYQVLYSCNSTTVCGCSKNSATVTKIVGGEDAGIATWGWAVSLQIGPGNICGGSIISKSWIITAAHCFVGYTANQVTVYASSNLPWSGMQIRNVSQIIVNSGYDNTIFINDIALLKLASPLNMSDPAISSICLPSVSASILAAGEWPPINTNVSLFLSFNLFHSLSTGCSSRLGCTRCRW
jgi:trypsin